MGVCFGPAFSFGQVPKFTIIPIAGSNVSGYSGDGGPAAAGEISFPAGITLDSSGNLYFADTSNSRIRKVDKNGIMTTFAGTGDFGFFGDGGVPTKALLNRPYGLAFDPAVNLYIADTYNDSIRKVTASSGLISTIAGFMEGFGGDGGPASGASLDTPTAVAVDAAGNLYIADTMNNRIRKVTTDGIINTIVGDGNSG